MVLFEILFRQPTFKKSLIFPYSAHNIKVLLLQGLDFEPQPTKNNGWWPKEPKTIYLLENGFIRKAIQQVK